MCPLSMCDCCTCSMLYSPLKKGYIMSHLAAKLFVQISHPSFSPSSHSLILSPCVSSMDAAVLSFSSIRNKKTGKTFHSSDLTQVETLRQMCICIYVCIYICIRIHDICSQGDSNLCWGKLWGIISNSSMVHNVEEPLKQALLPQNSWGETIDTDEANEQMLPYHFFLTSWN